MVMYITKYTMPLEKIFVLVVLYGHIVIMSYLEILMLNQLILLIFI